MRKSRKIIWWVLSAILVVVAIVVIANRDYLVDWYRGMSYNPTDEMKRIMNDLNLTDRGEFLFKASQPVLNERDEFNTVCRMNQEAESAVLGCYSGGGIYVYDINAEELDGIRELTSAHELLHAVWARLSEGDRRALTEDLTHVFEDNQEFLEEEINVYDIAEKQEELYVRAGTEIANLPEKLEEHYAGIFRNQDAVVGFYNKYISKFRELETEMESLKGEMEKLKGTIETRMTEYGERTAKLNEEIKAFNECAQTAGCFNSQWAFNAKREELTRERDAVEAMYTEIGKMVDRYNVLVEKYNADVLYNDRLNSMINSNAKPAAVE